MNKAMLFITVIMAAQYAYDHGDLGHILDACAELFEMIVEGEPMHVIRETQSYQIIMAFSVGESRGENGNGKHGKREVWE